MKFLLCRQGGGGGGTVAVSRVMRGSYGVFLPIRYSMKLSAIVSRRVKKYWGVKVEGNRQHEEGK